MDGYYKYTTLRTIFCSSTDWNQSASKEILIHFNLLIKYVLISGENKFFENLMFCFLVKLIGVTNWLLWFDEERKLRGKHLISVRNLATGNGNRNLKTARFKNRAKIFCQITTRDFSCSFNRWNSTGEDVWQN